MPVSYARIRHAQDTNTIPCEAESFDAFAQLLSVHDERAEKDGPSFIPAAFGHPYRLDQNVESVSMLVLDFDQGGIDDTALLTLSSLDAFAYTTHSHAPPLALKYRVVVALDRPVLAAEWRRFWERARTLFPTVTADPSCCNESRLYFLPSVPPERASDAEFVRFDGVPLDVDDVLSLGLPLGALRSVVRTPYTGGKITAAQKADALRVLDEMCASVRAQPPHPAPIHHRLNQASWIVGTRVPHMLDRAVAEERLLAAAVARNPDPAKRERYIQKIADGLDDGQEQPWDPNPAPPPDPNRQTVHFLSSEMREFVDHAHRIIGQRPNVYCRDRALVHVVRDARPAPGFDRPKSIPTIAEISVPTARAELARGAAWYVFQGGDKPPKQVAPPKDFVEALCHAKEYPTVRRLEAVVQTPVLRADGTVLDVPGYDEATGILYEPNADYGTIPVAPTREDVAQAIAAIDDVIAEFPFEEPAHISVFYAAVLTPIARPAFDGPSPMFLFDSPMRGSGKGLLSNVASIIATGATPTTGVFVDSPEEMEKRITTWSMSGDRVVCFDDVSYVGGHALQSALTNAGEWSGRKLGKNEKAGGALRMMWMATGNNIEIRGDMERRVLQVRIVYDDENPEERSYRYPNLLAHVREHRISLFRAALTILRAYCAAGCPKQALLEFNSFYSWNELVRGALVFAGLPDPCVVRQSMKASGADAEHETRLTLVQGLAEIVARGGGESIYLRDLLRDWQSTHAQSNFARAVREALGLKMFEAPSTKQLSGLLRKLVKRPVSGMIITSRTDRDGISKWNVEKIGATP